MHAGLYLRLEAHVVSLGELSFWKSSNCEHCYCVYCGHPKTEFLDVQTLKGPDSKLKAEAKVRRLHLTYFDHSRNKSESKAKIKPMTEALKCHYCNLKYFLEEERGDLENFWHNTTT
jgi:hypothetical protein